MAISKVAHNSCADLKELSIRLDCADPIGVQLFLNILEAFHKAGLDPRASSLEVAVFGAEPWTEAMRREIEDAFDLNAVDIYGLSEIMGPGVANECIETKDGPVIWEDHFYPEIIDPETGAPLPDGKEGELVFTTLSKEGMPMIRYRTRDLTRLLPGTARSMLYRVPQKSVRNPAQLARQASWCRSGGGRQVQRVSMPNAKEREGENGNCARNSEQAALETDYVV